MSILGGQNFTPTSRPSSSAVTILPQEQADRLRHKRQEIKVATMRSQRSAVEEEHARGVQLEVDIDTAKKQVPGCALQAAIPASRQRFPAAL